MNANRLDDKPVRKSRLGIPLFFVCCFAVSLCLLAGELEKQHGLSIEEKRTAIRSVADSERMMWEEEQRVHVGEDHNLNTESIPQLSKMAVDLLARAGNPEYILSSAIDKSEKDLDQTITQPPWSKSTAPENNKFWRIIYRKTFDKDHDWWLEQNTWFGQYRLVGRANQRIYFTIRDESKLRMVLSNIIAFGKQQDSSRRFIQVVTDKNTAVHDECKKLTLERARKIFPETVGLSANVYAIHPCNPYALIPLERFFATLALDKANECVVLLGKMGAKSVRITRLASETASGEASVKTHTLSVGGSAVRELRSEMDFQVEFSGKPDAVLSPDFLQNSIWHQNDSQLSAILESLSGNNPIKEWTFSEKEMSHFDFDIGAAARILGMNAADLNAEFEKDKKETRTFHVRF